MGAERRLFFATDADGKVKIGGPWAVGEIKGPAVPAHGIANTTASLIAAANEGRKSLMIYNLGSVEYLYLGPDASVTAANGFPVAPGAIFIDNISNSAWYAITNATSSAWRSLEVTTE